MIDPTLSLAAAADRLWDVIVIGAGPAGAVAAHESARCGASVLLVDASPFPRPKVCGCCLSAAAIGLMRDIDLGGVIESCGGSSLSRLHLAARNRSTCIALPRGAAISRSVLDAAIVGGAIERGAAFLPATRASLNGAGKRSRRLTLRAGDRSVAAEARIVLVADGLGGRAAQAHDDLRDQTAAGSRFGAAAIVDAAPAAYERGAIYMACGDGGYVGAVRLEDGSLNVAAAFDVQTVRAAGGPGAATERILASTGVPPVERIRDAEWRGTRRLTRRRQRVAAHRVLVLGDSAGYVEPFTGEGMAWAMASAIAAAPLAVEATRITRWSPDIEIAWHRRCRHLLSGRRVRCRLIARLLQHPRLISGVIAMSALLPVLGKSLAHHIHAPIRVRQTASATARL